MNEISIRITGALPLTPYRFYIRRWMPGYGDCLDLMLEERQTDLSGQATVIRQVGFPDPLGTEYLAYARALLPASAPSTGTPVDDVAPIITQEFSYRLDHNP